MIATVHGEAVLLTGTELAIVRAALAEFLRMRTSPLQPHAAATLHRVLRPQRPSRDETTVTRLDGASSPVTDTNGAAAHLGITPAGVRARIHRGTLPATRTATGWQIRRTDLERL